MLKKKIKSTDSNSSILRKLKKKWRFWRVFRFYFLRSKKKNFFPKMNWLFNQRRIIWHQLSVVYGKKIKNCVYVNHKSKKIFSSKFGSILCKLELRLNILVVRMGFIDKLRLADQFIREGKVKVNFFRRQRRYLVRINDLICFITTFFKLHNLKRLKKTNWRHSKWNKWKNQSKNKKFRHIYFSLKKSFIFNFMEINYYYFFSILIRYPLLGEISYRNKKKFLTRCLLQKVYFLY